MAKEFRISLPNRPGQLARLAEGLGHRGVNILAVAGIGAPKSFMALVVDQEDKTREALSKLRLKFREVELLTVDVPHRPGELGIFARKMADAKINIQSIYLLEGPVGEVKVALTVSDLNKAKQKLSL
ncbi:MAG: ACT domain-containing protein [Acidobacteriota bacterium]